MSAGSTRPDDAGQGPHVVFCGGCNPHIDRGAVAAEIAVDDDGAGPGTTVYLSGCPRACASDHRLTGDEPGHVVVAGETVDGRPVRQHEITTTVIQKLKE